MVEKYGCFLVHFSGRVSLELCNESWVRIFGLVDGCAAAESGRVLGITFIVLGLVMPWKLFCSDEDTSCEFG